MSPKFLSQCVKGELQGRGPGLVWANVKQDANRQISIVTHFGFNLSAFQPPSAVGDYERTLANWRSAIAPKHHRSRRCRLFLGIPAGSAHPVSLS